jgi:hypothetical protein
VLPGPTTADGLASLELGDAVVRSMRDHEVVEMAPGVAPKLRPMRRGGAG